MNMQVEKPKHEQSGSPSEDEIGSRSSQVYACAHVALRVIHMSNRCVSKFCVRRLSDSESVLEEEACPSGGGAHYFRAEVMLAGGHEMTDEEIEEIDKPVRPSTTGTASTPEAAGRVEAEAQGPEQEGADSGQPAQGQAAHSFVTVDPITENSFGVSTMVSACFRRRGEDWVRGGRGRSTPRLREASVEGGAGKNSGCCQSR